jgi:transglutaminase/protease-like cytokinesis protein 3
MTWNHRVIRILDDTDNSYIYSICEVYYGDDGSLMGFSEPIIVAESIENLHIETNRLAECISKPVLEESEFYKDGRIQLK